MADPAPELLVIPEGGIRVVTLNRPELLNAAGDHLLRRLAAVWGEIALDPEARVVILTGAGRAFSAGGDFAHFTRNAQDLDYCISGLDNERNLVRAMLDFPLPVICAVNGPAVGFAATLLGLSDIVLISDKAYIAEPHVNVGLVVGDGIAVSWPFLMSLQKAKEYIFTGDRIQPVEAVALGLANRVVPHDDLMADARALAEKLMKQPRRMLCDSKRIMNLHMQQIAGPILDSVFAYQRSASQGPDHQRIVADAIAKNEAKKRGSS